MYIKKIKIVGNTGNKPIFLYGFMAAEYSSTENNTAMFMCYGSRV